MRKMSQTSPEKAYRRSKAASQRWNEKYRRLLFIGACREWRAGKSDLPTLRKYLTGQADVMKDYGLTDSMHEERYGRPYPRPEPDHPDYKNYQDQMRRLNRAREVRGLAEREALLGDLTIGTSDISNLKL